MEVADFRALPDLWLIVRVGFDRFSECDQGICAASLIDRKGFAAGFNLSSCAACADIVGCRASRPRSRTDESRVRR